MKVFNLTFIAAALFVIAACTKNDSEKAIVDGNITSDVQVIPLDDALKTLGDFMADIEPDRPLTKSGLTREIASIDTHYKANALTKAGEPLPDAYVLNFANNEGFAVLGANTDVAPIVALTDNGSIDINKLNDDNNTEKEQYEPTYDEYGDFVCFVRDQREYVVEAIKDGIDKPRRTGSTTTQYAVVSPMLTTRWTQGKWDEQSDYNKYCARKGGGYAAAGCSTIAAAQIIAYNASAHNRSYPIYYLGQNTNVNCSEITSYSYIADIPSMTYRDQASRLIGWIFDNVPKSVGRDGTGISAAAIANFLTCHAAWYNNVTKHEDTCYSNYMMKLTSDMLKVGKPVFISAYTGTLGEGHSWVIDGAKYASNGYYQGDWMVHCNWGWRGQDNGYFSVNCLMPSDPNAEFDDGVPYNDNYKEFLRKFRVVTYDLIIQ